MAALPFSFGNYAKSFAGRFKDFHLGKAYRDVCQIIIKKVPHRIKQFTQMGLSLSNRGRLFIPLHADTPDVERFAQAHSYQCS